MKRRTLLTLAPIAAALPITGWTQSQEQPTPYLNTPPNTLQLEVVRAYFTLSKTPDYEKAVDLYLSDNVRYKGTGREVMVGKDYIKQRLAQHREGFGYPSAESIDADSSFSLADNGDILVTYTHDKQHVGDFRGMPATQKVLEGLTAHYIFQVDANGMILAYMKTIDYPLMARRMGVSTEQIIHG